MVPRCVRGAGYSKVSGDLRDKLEAIIESHPELKEVLNEAFERCKAGKIFYQGVHKKPDQAEKMHYKACSVIRLGHELT